MFRRNPGFFYFCVSPRRHHYRSSLIVFVSYMGQDFFRVVFLVVISFSWFVWASWLGFWCDDYLSL